MFVSSFSIALSSPVQEEPLVHETDSIKIRALLKTSQENWNKDPYLAQESAKEAFLLAQKQNIPYLQALALARLGASLWALGEYDQALESYLNALVHEEKVKHPALRTNILNGLGLVYDELKEYKLSIQYYNQVLQIAEAENLTKIRARCFNNLGAVYFDLEKYDSAVWYLENALQIRIESKDTFGMAESYNNVGYTQLMRDDPDQALKNFFRSLDIWQAIDGTNGMTYTLKNIGQAYLDKKAYAKAEKYLLQALDVGKSIDNRKWEIETLAVLKELEASRHNFEQVLHYDIQYDALRDSLLNAEKTRQIAEMETRFETAEKEREIEIQQKKIEVLRQEQQIKALWSNILALLLALISVLAICTVRYQQLKRKKDKQLFAAQQALANAELENASLKEQELSHALHVKNKELTSYSLNFLQKKELMDEVKEQLGELRKISDEKIGKQLKTVQRTLEQHHLADKEWEDFKLHFEQVHEDFFRNLKASFPDLTPNELKVCALMRLNLNTKEMAGILGIAASSVKVARYRIRKKLSLKREENLPDYLRQFDSFQAKREEKVS